MAEWVGFGNRFHTPTTGIVITGGSANTKGSYGQMSASLPFAVDGLIFHVLGQTGAGSYLIDVAIGAASSEKVVLANFMIQQSTANSAPGGTGAYIPLRLPSGARLSARCQASIGSGQLVPEFQLFGGGHNTFSFDVATTYGANTGDSGGVEIDTGATPDTKGAWAEVTSSTTAPIRWLIVCMGNRANTDDVVGYLLIDIGIGAGGSEKILVPDLRFVKGTGARTLQPPAVSFPCAIPPSTRIAARGQSGTTDATDRLHDIVLIGLS